MSTEISKLPELTDTNFVALRPDNPLAEARKYNDEAMDASSLVWVKTPAGGLTTFTFDDGLGNEETAKEICGALVLLKKRAILWPSDGEAVEGTVPLLVSDDLQTARMVGEDYGDLDPAIIDGAKIPGTDKYDIRSTEKGGKFFYTSFGSGRNGGCRMKEQRVLGILREGDLFPLMVTVQPGSLKNITKVVSRLVWPYFRCRVRLTLEEAKNSSGQKYSQIKMGVDPQPLSEEEGLALFNLYSLPLQEALAGGASEFESRDAENDETSEYEEFEG